jgi:glutathione S-transferase
MEHGVGAFTDDEIDKRGREDLEALAIFLGDDSYVLGDQPTSVDATVYSFLWQIMNGPYSSALKSAALERENLVGYVLRITKEWFADDPMSLEREMS